MKMFLACAALALVIVGQSASLEAQTFTVLYAFQGPPADGANAFDGVILGPNGTIYGSTEAGGSGCCGTLYRLDKNGKEMVLYNFQGTGDGMFPGKGLIRAVDGNLYGTTQQGGTASLGTVYAFTKEGVETVLHNFTGTPDGATPFAGVIVDSKGNLYGSTESGGDSSCGDGYGCGTVYKVNESGNEAVLYSFKGGKERCLSGSKLTFGPFWHPLRHRANRRRLSLQCSLRMRNCFHAD